MQVDGIAPKGNFIERTLEWERRFRAAAGMLDGMPSDWQEVFREAYLAEADSLARQVCAMVAGFALVEGRCVPVEWGSPRPHGVLYYCCSALCPGYPFRASEQRHPCPETAGGTLTTLNEIDSAIADSVGDGQGGQGGQGDALPEPRVFWSADVPFLSRYPTRHLETCSMCQGKGTVYKMPAGWGVCPACNGKCGVWRER